MVLQRLEEPGQTTHPLLCMIGAEKTQENADPNEVLSLEILSDIAEFRDLLREVEDNPHQRNAVEAVLNTKSGMVNIQGVPGECVLCCAYILNAVM